MITDRQVALLRQRRMEGKIQETAAVLAGMSVRSARKWQSGLLPSETKQERQWRTRPDPFDEVWEDEIEPLLRGDPGGKLKATTIIDWLAEQHPGRFSAAQLRTLQRRLQDWRALHGPDQEVYFPQVHPPGREAQIDFTHGNALGVTIAGQPYPHLLFQLILSHSGWRYAQVASGETFLALRQGLQAALWTLGGVPEVVRSDNTSAATNEVKRSRGRALNDSYAALLDHCRFQNASPTISDRARSPIDATGRRNNHLLALGCGEENLFPGIRGTGGAIDFFPAHPPLRRCCALPTRAWRRPGVRPLRPHPPRLRRPVETLRRLVWRRRPARPAGGTPHRGPLPGRPRQCRRPSSPIPSPSSASLPRNPVAVAWRRPSRPPSPPDATWPWWPYCRMGG